MEGGTASPAEQEVEIVGKTELATGSSARGACRRWPTRERLAAMATVVGKNMSVPLISSRRKMPFGSIVLLRTRVKRWNSPCKWLGPSSRVWSGR